MAFDSMLHFRLDSVSTPGCVHSVQASRFDAAGLHQMTMQANERDEKQSKRSLDEVPPLKELTARADSAAKHDDCTNPLISLAHTHQNHLLGLQPNNCKKVCAMPPTPLALALTA